MKTLLQAGLRLASFLILLEGSGVTVVEAGSRQSGASMIFQMRAESGLGISGIAVSERSEELRFAPAGTEEGLAFASPEFPPRGHGPATAVLEVAKTAESIRRWDFDLRDQLVADLETRLDASGVAVVALGQRRENLDGDQAAVFFATFRQVETAGKQLRSTLKAIRSAGSGTWNEVRLAAARDFAAYARAVACAEALVISRDGEAGSQGSG